MLRVSEYDTDARRFDDGSPVDPRLPAAKAALDSARDKLRRCERETAALESLNEKSSAAAFDDALKTVSDNAAARGDIAGAIMALHMSPKRAGEA
jgi:hypothetical protein